MGGGITPRDDSSEKEDPFSPFEECSSHGIPHEGMDGERKSGLFSRSGRRELEYAGKAAPYAGGSTGDEGGPMPMRVGSSAWTGEEMDLDELEPPEESDYKSSRYREHAPIAKHAGHETTHLLEVDGAREARTKEGVLAHMGGVIMEKGGVSGLNPIRQVVTGPVTSRVFKLMEIRHDNQDMTVVEKVILSEDNIFSLCNTLVSNSAKISDGKRIIDFARLDARSNTVIGFYGSKTIMRGIFHRLGFATEVEVWGQMKTDALSPGLYLWLRRDSAYVFFWHHGESLPDASQRGMACNFVRYVVDLCDTVIVCLEAENLKDSLFSSVQKFSKKQRTQRLKIALVKASENSISVSPGFSMVPKSLARENARQFKWTEGADRLALLASFPRPPKVTTSKHTQKIKWDLFPSKVGIWKDDYRLDLSRLSDEDLIIFLHAAKTKQIEDYRSLQKHHDTRKDAWHQRKVGIDEVKAVEERSLQNFLTSYIDTCLRIEFPAEHLLFRSVQSSTKDLGNDEKPTTGERTKAELGGSLEENQKVLSDLESNIYNTIFGEKSASRLVFPGAQCYVQDMRTSRYITAEGTRGKLIFTMEHDGQRTSGRRSDKEMPFRYGNAIVLRSGSQYKTGNLYRHLDFTEVKSDGLIVNDDAALVDRISKVKLEFLSTGLNGLETWVRSEAQSTIIKDLYRKALFVTSVLPTLDEKRKREYRGNVVQMLLESEDVLKDVQPLLSSGKESYESAQSKWIGLEAEESLHIDSDNQYVSEDVKNICFDIYTKQYNSVQWRVCTIALKFCEPFVARKIDIQMSREYQILTATSKKEKKEFLSQVKEDFSPRNSEHTLTLWIESCKFVLKEDGVVRYIVRKVIPLTEKCEAVSVTFEQEKREAECLTWKAFELAPLKDDMDKILNDPSYVVSPPCSEGKDVIDVDPKTYRLLRTFYLIGGQVLVFIEDIKGSELQLYLGQKMGIDLSWASPIKTMKRGYELFCFDERTRYIAFYDSSIATIRVHRFDDSFRSMDWTGVSVQLSEYSVGRLIWMEFITGKREIAFIDDQHRLRVCEVSQPSIVRPGHIHVGPSPIIKAIASAQGSCLLVLRLVAKASHQGKDVGEKHEDLEETNEEFDIGSGEEQERTLMMDIYKLDDTILRVDSMSLQLTDSPTDYQFALVCFGAQQHLVYHSRKSPQRVMSKILKIVSASDMCKIQQITRSEDLKESESSADSEGQPGPILDYIPQIFDKYATSPALAGDEVRQAHLILVMNSSVLKGSSTSLLREKCLRYVESSIDRLRKQKGKDFTALQVVTSFYGVTDTGDLDTVAQKISAIKHQCRSTAGTSTVGSTMSTWITRLICLVPIQIARAENNSLQPMIDGLQLSTNADFVDAISLANVIRFGLYEAVINPWVGPIKVISSMGKQSSGKSYLLNHLSGSLLDVAGGRCTDGVWMAVRQCKGCLYVLLDFEGLGSFERSEQEDMLLSIFNAAISNMTIFNKKDFHLDKETEAIFQRFQNGVNLVKADSKLFRGLFYMAIKDVDTSDVEDLKKEFFSKISQICSKSQDNFLTKMYGGSVEISAMPFFNRPEFHESIRDIGLTVEEIEASFSSGKSFLRDVKLIMAQITTKDWSSIDSKRVALRISLLRHHLDSAISTGAIITDGCEPLIAFDDQTEIPDGSLEIAGIRFSILDTRLELRPFKRFRDTDDVLKYLTDCFKESSPRDGSNDETWHLALETFNSALAERRKQRVLDWLARNTVDFANDGDSQKLNLEAVARLSEMQRKLLLCSCKCENCFLRCILEKGHSSNHSCRGDHRCPKTCTYCEEENEGRIHYELNVCGDVAGHDGPHACRGKNHTCGKSCSFVKLSSSCNDTCSKKIGHGRDHRCNSKQHNCKNICSLPSCNHPCVHSIDGGGHDENDIHECHEKFCPEQCSLDGCNRTCASKDHFHGQKAGVGHHLCGKEHPCPEICEHQGNCEVLTEVSRKTKTFQGKRCTFDYELVSEQNGKRKGCCLPIPPYKTTHEGPHLHSCDSNAVHFCEIRCYSCGYFCTREIGHGGPHKTTHGNMRDVKFAAESEEIDIQDRKYVWGESGVAELCNMHCKAQGRGHVHLIQCPGSAGGVCRKTFDGSRHETCKYGPDFNAPKDELTHTAYWEYMRFEDPCSNDERKEFDLCNHQCKSEEHDPSSGSAPSASTAAQHASYCTEALWHDSVVRGDIKFGTGYITEDGHHFSCDHSKNVSSSVIFIIDRSSSMSTADIRPGMAKFVANRLGCVYEAITRFIRTRLTQIQEDVVSVVLFNHHATTAVELEPLNEGVVDKLLGQGACGSTTYSSGLLEAERILKRSTGDPVLSFKCPTIVFLSDGGNNGGTDPVHHIRQMKALDPRLKVHTIMFGHDPAHKILHDMARGGDGSFEASLDEVQLSRRFEGLARSLKRKVASLM